MIYIYIYIYSSFVHSTPTHWVFMFEAAVLAKLWGQCDGAILLFCLSGTYSALGEMDLLKIQVQENMKIAFIGISSECYIQMGNEDLSFLEGIWEVCAEKRPSLHHSENGFEFEEMMCGGNRIDQGAGCVGARHGGQGPAVIQSWEVPSVQCGWRCDLAGWGQITRSLECCSKECRPSTVC